MRSIGRNIDFAIISAAVLYPSAGSLGTHGAYVQTSMLFTFQFQDAHGNPISQSGSSIAISNVQLMFGTEGAFLVPEPATMLLLGTGLIGLAAVGRRKFFKK